MARIRAFAREDIPDVGRLYLRSFRGIAGTPSDGLIQYFDLVFFQNPYGDDALPSLVYEDDRGRIIGFLGVITRRLSMKGRPLRMAVSTQFMVDPDSRNSFAALHLMQRFLTGPQDLALADGANAASRRLWERSGGTTVPLYSFYWTRPLRPVRHAVDSITHHPSLRRIINSMTRPVCAVVDSIWQRVHGDHGPEGLTEEDLDLQALCEDLPKISARMVLAPVYDMASLTWIMELVRHKTKHGPLQATVVRNTRGNVVGWHLYYLNRNVSQVIQIAASHGAEEEIMNHLFYHAWQRGSAAISGRLEPKYMHELSRAHCRFTTGSAFLIHAKDREILHAIATGEAFLSRLEGEWWNCFSEFPQ
jgi:hypothetical protein